MNTFYLNNAGTRWVNKEADGTPERIRVSFTGYAYKVMSVKHWEQCGNTAFPTVRHKGKDVCVYPPNDDSGIWMPYKVKYAQAFKDMSQWSDLEDV